MTQLKQIELIEVILRELARQGIEFATQAQTNAIIKATNDIILALEKPRVMASPGMGLHPWLAGDDTGLSSKYMASVLSYGEVFFNYAHPHDTDDFGRCSRLLDAVPEFRELLGLMRGQSAEWNRLVDEWERIEELIREGKSGEANDLIRRCVRS